MRSGPQRAAEAPADFPSIAAPIARDLEQVDDLIARALHSDSPAVQKLVEHVARFGGKRVRPAVLLLFARVFGDIDDTHRTLAAVVEMIHLATLVHDDVLDHASTRRRLPSVNALHGNHVPILLGDVIYATAFTMTTHWEDPTASRVLAQTTLELCTGEIEQNMSRGRLDLSIAEYERIIEKKTASLVAASARLGAYGASAPAALVEAADRYGRLVGLAFQIVDDCLDLSGDERLVGKSLGTDRDERKLTLPLIHLLGRLDATGRHEVRRVLEDPAVADRRRELRRSFDLGPDLGFARRCAQDKVAAALKALSGFPAGQAREALAAIAAFVVARDR